MQTPWKLVTGSALALVLGATAFAYGADLLSAPWGMGLLHGLKIVAVAVVAQAVYGMATSLAPAINARKSR